MDIRTEIITLEGRLKTTIEIFENETRLRVSDVSVIHGSPAYPETKNTIEMVRVKTSVGDYSE